jgi:hypothetical protein
MTGRDLQGPICKGPLSYFICKKIKIELGWSLTAVREPTVEQHLPQHVFKHSQILPFKFVLPMTSDLSAKNLLTIVMKRQGERSRLLETSHGGGVVVNTKWETFKDRKQGA